MKVNWHIFVGKEHFKVLGETYKNVQEMGKDRKKLKIHFEGMNIGFVRVFAVLGK